MRDFFRALVFKVDFIVFSRIVWCVILSVMLLIGYKSTQLGNVSMMIAVFLWGYLLGKLEADFDD